MDPADGRSKLICKEFNENDVCKLLAVSRVLPVVLVPLPKDLFKARRLCLIVDGVDVFTRDIKRLGDEIGNILADKHVRIKMSRVNLLRQVYEKD